MFRNKDTIIKELHNDNREYIRYIVNFDYDKETLILVFNLLNKCENEDMRYFLLYVHRNLTKNPFLAKELYLVEGLYDKLCEYMFYENISIKLLVSQILSIIIDVAKVENISSDLIKEIAGVLERSIAPQHILICLENRSNEILLETEAYKNICELMMGNCIPYVCDLCARILLRLSENNESLIKECLIKNYRELEFSKQYMPYVQELLKLVN